MEVASVDPSSNVPDQENDQETSRLCLKGISRILSEVAKEKGNKNDLIAWDLNWDAGGDWRQAS